MKVLANILQTTKPAFPGKPPGKSLGVSSPAAGGNVVLEKTRVDYKTLIKRQLHRRSGSVAPKPGHADRSELQYLSGLGKAMTGQVLQLGKKNLNKGTAVAEGTVEVLAFGTQQINPLGQDSVGELVEQLASDTGAGQGRLAGINGPAKGIWTGQFVTAPRSDSAKGIGTSEFIAAPRGEPAKGIGTSQFADPLLGQGLTGTPKISLPSGMVNAEAVGTQIEDGTENNPAQVSQGGGKSEMNAAQQLQALDIGPTGAKAELPGQASQTAVNVLAALSAGERPVGGGQVAAKVELGAVNNLGHTVNAGPAVAVSGAFSQPSGKPTHAELMGKNVKTAGESASKRFGRVALKAQGQLQQNLSGVLGETTQTPSSDLPEGFQLGQNQQFVAKAILSGQANGAEQVLKEVSETSVVSQISQAFRAGNARTDGQLVIRLHPPELGEVRIELQSEGKDVRAILRVDNPRTLVELQQEAPALIARLGQSGVEVRRIDIILNEQSNTDSSYAELQENQSGRGQEYAEAQMENFGDEIAADSNELVGVGQSAYMQNQVSDSSINVWM